MSITGQEKRASRIVMEGRAAAHAGSSSRDCPYTSAQHRERGEWMQGYGRTRLAMVRR